MCLNTENKYPCVIFFETKIRNCVHVIMKKKPPKDQKRTRKINKK